MNKTLRWLLLALGGVLLVRHVRRSAPPSRVLTASEVTRLYNRLAPAYHLAGRAYRAVGAARFHEQAVAHLQLERGATVVDLGCGTGANFPYLYEAVGPAGHIIGVDLSPGMLKHARQRATEHGWENVTLVQHDMRTFPWPERVDGVLSTFALEMVPEHEAITSAAVTALAPGGRVAMGGLRRPERWPEWLIRLGAWINRPLGVNRAYASVQPWRSIQAHMSTTTYSEHLTGAVYLATGRKPETPSTNLEL